MENFNYTYSAKEQEEIKKIRQKYVAGEVDKMEQVRKLDRSVTKKAEMVSIILGVIGALILGSGMSLIMTDIKEMLGLTDIALPFGIIIGVVGIICVGIAYPMYVRIVKKEREKIAPLIIKLTDELMK